MKLLRILCIFLVVLSSLGQPAQNYRVAVIVGVKPQQPAAEDASGPTEATNWYPRFGRVSMNTGLSGRSPNAFRISRTYFLRTS
jgi:hypothetical protein